MHHILWNGLFLIPRFLQWGRRRGGVWVVGEAASNIAAFLRGVSRNNVYQLVKKVILACVCSDTRITQRICHQRHGPQSLHQLREAAGALSALFFAAGWGQNHRPSTSTTVRQLRLTMSACKYVRMLAEKTRLSAAKKCCFSNSHKLLLYTNPASLSQSYYT